MLSKNKSLQDKCTGCSACQNVCPSQAICMVLDKEGFLYPRINTNKCTNCGLCLQVCPALNEIDNRNRIPEKVYASKSKNKETQLSSSSGGVFSELAKEILEKDGIVFGVTFKNGKACHVAIDKKKDLDKIKGSKYLQSYINDSYRQVENLLKKNKKVLFSGTPCQIAGLKSFLFLKNTNTKNLYTIGLFCHGVPSYKVFKDHCNWLCKKFGDLQDIKFRNKKFGWKFSALVYKFINPSGNCIKKVVEHKKDAFMIGYLKNYYLRKSCYKCKFDTLPRQADITLADFWGIKKKYFDPKGVSLVLINNKKGKKLFRQINKSIESKALNFKEVEKNVHLKLNCCKERDYMKRENFFIDYFNKGYTYCKEKYLGISFKEIFINFLSKLKWKILK